jgi:hypothetical protein
MRVRRFAGAFTAALLSESEFTELENLQNEDWD